VGAKGPRLNIPDVSIAGYSERRYNKDLGSDPSLPLVNIVIKNLTGHKYLSSGEVFTLAIITVFNKLRRSKVPEKIAHVNHKEAEVLAAQLGLSSGLQKAKRLVFMHLANPGYKIVRFVGVLVIAHVLATQ
jgi:hypothetical protein